jgi:hypothetical protein
MGLDNAYYVLIGIPSIFNGATTIGGSHLSYWTEVLANAMSSEYFGDTYSRNEYVYPTKKKK